MRYQMNENFFEKIDDVQKAWMLGFIAANGCIYKRNGHQSMLVISVRDYDVEVLEIFKKMYGSEVASLSRKKEVAKDLCSRIENNSTNRSENKKALEYYNLWF